MTNRQSGYYRFPTIHSDRVVFVCEDDLWTVPTEGGLAIRLTANLAEVSRPFLSPDGTQLAFMGREEGHMEVYCMPADGGAAKRLTFLGAYSRVVGWSLDGKSILFASNTGQPFWGISNLYAISADGGLPEQLPIGMAHNICYGSNGGVVIGRHTSDPARWKRYRGGTAGVLWIDPEGTGEFRKLIDLKGNQASPMWVGDRICFISDHEGIGNLYCCTPYGEDLQRLTNGSEYYVRNASTDGKQIVYHAGGDLFCYNLDSQENRKIEVNFHSPQVQRQRKFVDAGRYLEDYSLHPEGHSTIVTCRGKSFYFGNWEGAVTQLSYSESIRYRLTRWLNDKQRFVTISDSGSVEAIEIYSTDINVEPEHLRGIDIGRAINMEVSPKANIVVLSNHRHELILVDLKEKQSKVLDKSDYQRIEGFCWSPDGKWVAYSCAETQLTYSIKVCDIEDGTTYRLTPPRFKDVRPSFDPEGKFIYFLSWREFNPVYDSIYFDLSFPRGMRPFLIALKKDTPSPFIPVPKPLSSTPPVVEKAAAEAVEKATASSEEESREKKTPAVEIDFDGIEHRIVGFPVPEGRYGQIWGLKGKVLFSSFPVQGSLGEDWNSDEPESKSTLEIYDFEEQKRDTIATEVTDFRVARESETLIYRSYNRLRVGAIARLNGG
ncbi:MAG TPA: peptidase, partial [Cyanophyceae cyanobacterium]